MGSSSSKFKKYLQHGDEYAAMQVYQSSAELRRALDPSHSYGDHHHHNTPLHYAARHGMKHLIRAFLNDLGGNPNRRNGRGQTSLHCVCSVSQQKSLSALERQSYSVILLLSWRGPCLPTGQRERVDVNAKDDTGCTALHYAALSGLKKCVEYLLAHGADPYCENKSGLTPCDLAMRENHHDIALLLESKMVFTGTPDELSSRRASTYETEEVYSGLRAQDLQEAKDQLIVETADMLHIPLFTAEALLRHSEWSREVLLEQWMRDPVATCQLAGVQPPFSALHLRLTSADNEQQQQQQLMQQQQQQQLPTSTGMKTLAPPTPKLKMLYSENSFVVDEELAEDEMLCEICCDLMEGSSAKRKEQDLSCKHNFCTRCWKNYLHTKIQDGKTDTISCPAFDCNIMVPVQVIERYVSPQMARKYLKFDLDCFVETNKSIKWCPYPACQRAVNLPESERQMWEDSSLIPPVSHAVDCGGGHFFCWDCGSPEAHAPLSCVLWKKWLARCAEAAPSGGSHASGCYDEAANFLWLITHSKPCPNCRSPIQKTDGCNHIKCSKCRYNFCWVCLESWKKHSAATGGYFQCNRYPNISAPSENEVSSNKSSMHRFIHYFTRYKNHANSRAMEEPLLRSAKKKREILRSSLTTDNIVAERKWSTLDRRGTTTFDSAEKNTKFYEDGVWELLKARTCLCGSYAYGFFMEEEVESGDESSQAIQQRKRVFEIMQNELEEITERLSEMIARPYLRTPRRVIIQTVQLCRRKRQEFLRSAYKGFVPQEISYAQQQQQPNHSKSLNNSLLNNNNNTLSYSSSPGQLSVDRQRVVESMSEDVCKRKGQNDLLWPKAAPGQIRLRQCCRAGCPNLCLSTTPPTSRLREFCSPNCSMKSGRRNTVEKFEPLPQIVEGAGAVTTGAGSLSSAGRYHTLPHHSSVNSAVAEEEDRQVSLAVELSLIESKVPPKVPPHQHLSTTSKSIPCISSAPAQPPATAVTPATAVVVTSAQKQARFSSKSVSTDGAEGRCLNEPNVGKNNSEPVVNLSSANETVASFLRSITFKEEDELSQNSSYETPNMANTVTFDAPQSTSVIRRTGEVADGKFRIGDIHESGGYNNDEKKAAALILLKRSQSTGDIDDEDKTDDAPYLDSDHSCCQEKPPEFRKSDNLKFEAAEDEEEESDTTSADATKNDVATTFSTTTLRGGIPGKDHQHLVSSKSENSLVLLKKPLKMCENMLDIGNRRRSKFVRQKSFEIDSDSTDIDASLTPSTELPLHPKTEIGMKNKAELLGGKPSQTVLTAAGTTGTGSGGSSTSSWNGSKRRPDLTIKIYNSSFDAGGGPDSDPTFRSPTLHISGIAISRSPPGQQQLQQQQQQQQQQSHSGAILSPKYHAAQASAGGPVTAPAPGVLTVNTAANRNRSSSLVVPPPTPQSGSRRSPHSPGSRSLHLSRVSSPYHPSRESSPSYMSAKSGKRGSSTSPNLSTCPELFTFPPIPLSESVAPANSADSTPVSTRQTLSSVLHVQDSNLSSDDFHEALFFDRSPKSAKKRRRSKKNLQTTPKREICDTAASAQEQIPPKNVGIGNNTGTGNKKSIKTGNSSSTAAQPSHICAH